VTDPGRKLAAQSLRALRQGRGFSWQDEARALRDTARRLRMPAVANAGLGTIQRTIARWESGAVRPSERYRVLLAHVFAEQDGSTFLGPGSDFDRLMAVFVRYGVETERISELRDLVAVAFTPGGGGLLAYLSPPLSGSLTAALADPGNTDRALIAGLASAVADLGSRVGAIPFVRIQLGLVPIAEACRVLLAGAVPDVLNQDLLKVTVTAYTLAARLAFEMYDDASSAGYYAEALSVAGRLPDPSHRATVRTSQAMVTLYSTGDLGHARHVADEAVKDALASGNVLIRARACALRAEMAARAADTRHAFAALHMAWNDIDRAASADPGPGGIDAGRLRGFEGLCHLYAGDPAKAERQFADSAATLRKPRDAVQRDIVLADQAMAHIRLGAIEAAVDLLHECVELAAGTRGRVAAQRIHDSRRALDGRRGERFVVELDDHIHTALLAGY
jgi:transcriptional regulator with XRE-family HTH domain